MKTLAALCLAFSACASTTFYRDGKRIARFQGDMANMHFHMSPNGAIDWSGDIDHSTATLAQGKAASDKIAAIGGAVAVSGIMALFR